VEAPPQANAAVAPAPTLAASAASEKSDADTLAADIAAQLPLVAPAVAPSRQAAASVPAAVAAQAAPRQRSESPPANSARAIAESTYAILGGGGQGTGVAIERDKLLTNCHVIAPNVHKGPLLAISAVTGAQTLITHAAFLVKRYRRRLRPWPQRQADADAMPPACPREYLQSRFCGPPDLLDRAARGLQRSGQNYRCRPVCDHSVSAAAGRPMAIWWASPGVRATSDSAFVDRGNRAQFDQTLIVIDGFPTDYLTNLQRNW
jgi:hypothetical protein